MTVRISPSAPNRLPEVEPTRVSTAETNAISGAYGRPASDLFTDKAAPAPAREPSNAPASTGFSPWPTFESARGTSRSPEDAVRYIDSLDARLGLSPAALEDRRANMTTDVVAFYAANPGLFHADLRGPFAQASKLLDGFAPMTLVLGDPHLRNFGAQRGPDGSPVFGANDFDQAAMGSPEMDLERLSVSAALIARQNGFGPDAERQIVETLAKSYTKEIARLAAGKSVASPFLDAAHAEGKLLKRLEDAGEATQADLLGEVLAQTDPPKFLREGELTAITPEEDTHVRTLLDEHSFPAGTGVQRPVEVIDVVGKVGGGSSRGLPRYYALVQGEDGQPRVLELKQLPPQAIEDDGTMTRGDAVAAVARQLELDGLHNPLTCSITDGESNWMLREIEPEKEKLKDKDLDEPKELESAVEQLAVILARSHARMPAAAEAINQWIGADRDVLASRLVDFTDAYATQVAADFRAIV